MKHKCAAAIFTLFAVLASNIMCVTVTAGYRDLLWGGKYAGSSAPPSTAFIFAIPYLLGILLFLAIASLCRRKDADIRRKVEGNDISRDDALWVIREIRRGKSAPA